MTDPKTLTIDLSEEYKIKIEEPQDIGNSFFKEIYKQAANAVDDIIVQTEKSDKNKDQNDPFLNEKQDYNNIIAFCGERGTGKSSAMITFAQSLLKLNDSKDFYAGKNLITKNFHTIQVIDPSLFEEHENIFEVILAQLFSSFEKELNKKEKESELNTKRELLEQFEKVYENLQTIRKNGQKYDGEALETLNKLACGANLRQNFKELVRLYLKFIVKKENCDNAYLIIPIDDFDLNINAAAEMAEQIRKYLMIPRVIVLMAVKIEQLADAKEQQVRKDFETLIKAGTLNESPKNITLQYVTKLIPNGRRIEMPHLESNIESIELIIKHKESIKKYKSIFEGFQFFCYYKANLYLSKNEFTSISIFPRTLRELKEFFIILHKSKGSIDFINFINDKFLAATPSQFNFFDKLLIIPDCEKNYFIINLIINDFLEMGVEKRILFNTLEVQNTKIAQFNLLIDSDNKSHNITLGDLLFFFKIITESRHRTLYKDFIDLIKILLSIWLSEAKNNKNYKRLMELTNGNVYDPNYKEIIRGQRSKFSIKNFGEIRINGVALQGAFSQLIPTKTIQMIEWLTYFIEYPISSKHQLYKNDSNSPFYFKDDVIPYYKREMDIGLGSILKDPVFNVLQILTSCIDPKLNFQRGFKSYFQSLKNRKNEEYLSYARKSMIWDMLSWQMQYGLIIPINNIFLFESIISQIDSDLRTKELGFHSHVVFLFDQIKTIIENLERSEPLLKKQNLSEALLMCPIAVPIYAQDSEYLMLLDSINNTISQKGDSDNKGNITRNQAIFDFTNRRSQLKIRALIMKYKPLLMQAGVFEQVLAKIDSGGNHIEVRNQILNTLRSFNG